MATRVAKPSDASDGDAELLLEIQAYPILYDSQRNDFKNKTLKSVAWQEIASVLSKTGVKPGATETYCSSAFERLKRRYRNETQPAPSGSEKKKSNWQHFAAMRALQAGHKFRTTTSNVPTPPKKKRTASLNPFDTMDYLFEEEEKETEDENENPFISTEPEFEDYSEQPDAGEATNFVNNESEDEPSSSPAPPPSRSAMASRKLAEYQKNLPATIAKKSKKTVSDERKEMRTQFQEVCNTIDGAMQRFDKPRRSNDATLSAKETFLLYVNAELQSTVKEVDEKTFRRVRSKVIDFLDELKDAVKLETV